MGNATDRLKAATARIEEARKEAATVAKEAFSEMVAEIFKIHANLAAFRWQQYTPYFNDGDACVFSANIDSCYIDVKEVGCDEWMDGDRVSTTRDWSTKPYRDLNVSELHPLHFAQKMASEALNAVGDEQLQAIFGDHMQITAHRDGTVDVDEYSHD